MQTENFKIAQQRILEALNQSEDYPRLNYRFSLPYFSIVANFNNPEYIDLSDLELESIPEELWDMKRLRVLRLNNNNLTFLPSQIGKLENLIILGLSNNSLETLPSEIGKLYFLEELTLENNPITHLPASMIHLVNLRNHYETGRIEGTGEVIVVTSRGLNLNGNMIPGLIDDVLNKEPVEIISHIIKLQEAPPPKLFISYSWDNNEHKKWILNLSEMLAKDGVDVILDQYELRLGKNLGMFMENSVSKADKVLIVLTENYKAKAENRVGGVGSEYSIIYSELYFSQSSNKKFLPVLRSGDYNTSIPSFIKSFITLDMRQSDNFDNSYENLLKEIYDIPPIVKPNIGRRPTWLNKSDSRN